MLVRHLGRLGYATVGCRSADEALEALEEFRPTIAVIDRDLSLMPSRHHTSDDVLARLAHSPHQACSVFMYSAHVDSAEALARLAYLHPRVMVQPKQAGMPALLDRISRLMQRKLGDLGVDHGRVVHLPSGSRWTHRSGLALFLAHPRAITVDPSDARALRRMREWLEANGSVCGIEDLGRQQYVLRVPASA